MKLLVLAAVVLIALGPGVARAQPVPPRAAFDHSHAVWTDVLKTYAAAGRVDYAALQQSRGRLDTYLAQLHAVTPAEFKTWTREQRFAFWINAYNAHCIDLVARAYPVDSIKDIGGLFSPVWTKAFIALPTLHPGGASTLLSLDDIEHGILRPTFRDARVHAALNCASTSCPALRQDAFVADRLDAQLDEQVRAWLADPTRNRFERAKGTARVSAIFRWYQGDFVRDAGSVRAWIAKYAPAELTGWLGSDATIDLGYLPYSWKLNDARKR